MEKETLDKCSNLQLKNEESYLKFYTTEVAKVRHLVLLINQLFSLQNRKRRYFEIVPLVLARDQKTVCSSHLLSMRKRKQFLAQECKRAKGNQNKKY